jgi:translation initiation factor 4E
MAAVAENAPLPVTNENTAPPAVATEEKTERSIGDIVTVFHDPENFNVKHPLMHEWTLWFTKPPSGKVRTRSILCSDKAFAHVVFQIIRATTGMIS